MKNGTAEQKREIHLLDQLQSRLTAKDKQAFPDTAMDIFQSQNSEPEQLTFDISFSTQGLLNILSSSEPLMYQNMEDQIIDFNKKRKKDVRRGYKSKHVISFLKQQSLSCPVSPYPLTD